MATAMPADRPAPAWRDRWAGLRDRLLASPRFQRWAAAFPLTRPIARRRSQALFDLCAGFVYSQILTVCVQLRLFERLRDGPQSAEELAPQLALPPEATARLLRAAAALDLLELRRGGRYGLGPLGAVVQGNPGIAAMVSHHDRLYADLADPVALLRGTHADTALSDYWPYAATTDPTSLPEERVAAYSNLMAQSQPMVASEVLAAYPVRRHRRLLDVGGGDGSFLRAVAEAAPKLELWLFDLPAVSALAARRFAPLGESASRVRTFGGDLFRDPLPAGADLISLVRVLHDHDDDRALAILQAAHDALPPGGTVLIAEPMTGASRAAAVGDAYFGFYLLAMGHGRARPAADYLTLLRRVGFIRPQIRPTRQPLLASVITARRTNM